MYTGRIRFGGRYSTSVHVKATMHIKMIHAVNISVRTIRVLITEKKPPLTVMRSLAISSGGESTVNLVGASVSLRDAGALRDLEEISAASGGTLAALAALSEVPTRDLIEMTHQLMNIRYRVDWWNAYHRMGFVNCDALFEEVHRLLSLWLELPPFFDFRLLHEKIPVDFHVAVQFDTPSYGVF